MASIFQHEDYVQNYGYQKIKYVMKLVGMYNSDVATVLDLDLDFVSKVLGSGVVQTPQDQEEINHNFYNLMILFNYLLKMSDNDADRLDGLLKSKPPKEATIYDDASNKPPWYRYGLLEYLKSTKVKGLESCVDWIREY
jgi:hypothetical protein